MSTNTKPIKGILKRPSTSAGDGSESRLKWDEANLEMNEGQKDATMKIDEPKTPYIRYDPETDQMCHLRLLTRNPRIFLWMQGTSRIDRALLEATKRESECISAMTTGTRTTKMMMMKVKLHSHALGLPVIVNPHPTPSHPAIAKKHHEEFAKKRAQHYNMGNVLRHRVDDIEDEDEQESTKPPAVPPIPKQHLDKMEE
ncbi:hypothetical protein BJV82DRAFT_336530 [Fennellomyces sp. T-0311]|nr:hypothetical protein BJV82DRAFT_336530 [Fennellomyces sp. T-0311]